MLARFIRWWRRGGIVDSHFRDSDREVELSRPDWGLDTQPTSGPGALDELVFEDIMKLYLIRRPSVGGATIGELTMEGHRLCYTLEDEIRERAGEPVANWKIHGRTAIPAGEYIVTLEHSPRFGPDTLTINNVPGFSGVRIHAGNTADDTEGCPLLGLRVTSASIVPGTSRPALVLVKDVVRGAIASGQRVLLVISNPVEVA